MNALMTSTRAELLRVRKWPATWMMASAWIILNLIFVYVFPYLAYRNGSSNPASDGVPRETLLAGMMPAAVPDSLIQGMPMFGGAIMLIVGALTVGSGYGWGTWKTVFTQGPRRLSAFGGTLVAIGGFVIMLVLATFAIDLGVSVLVATVESQDIVWPALGEIGPAIGAGVLIFGMWAGGDVLIGTLARGPALAIGLGLVWSLVLENLLRGVSGLLGPLEGVTDYLPGTAAGSLVGAFGLTGAGEADGTPGVLSILDGTQAAWLVAAYIAVFVGVAAVLVRRRDVV